MDNKGGWKLDNDKIRYELLPPIALHARATIFTFGAKKYDDRNWEKGISYSRLFGALMRHLWAWWSGVDKDDESGESHLWHAGCCLDMLIHHEQYKKDFDDRPKEINEGDS